MQKLYFSCVFRRNEVAKEICEYCNIIKKFVDDDNIQKLYDYYKNINRFITDEKLFFFFLLKLANIKEKKYIIKKFYATNVRADIYRIDKDSTYGINYVIGEKNILDSIDSKKIYYRDEFGHYFDEILKCGYSSVSMTENGLGIIIENSYKPEKITILDFMTTGNVSNIDCYLFDDELSDAVYMFQRFIEENGADIMFMNEIELIKSIKSYSKKNNNNSII